MLYVVNPRARGDMKFPVSKQPCIIMFLCLFLRLFCAMRVTRFLRSVYIIIFLFSSCPLFKKATVIAGKKINCPLKNKCLTSSAVCNANITTESDTTGKNYIGLTEGTNNVTSNTNFLFGKGTIHTARNYQNIFGHSTTMQQNQFCN